MPETQSTPDQSIRRERLRRAVGRRAFLASIVRGTLGVGFAYSLAPKLTIVTPPEAQRHLAWVWQFSEDGAPDTLRPVLSANRLGIVLKTHDGTDWMADFDDSEAAVSGPAQIARLSRYFEAGGVPFHAWCVLRGLEPETEALMAAQVIDWGARSIFLDLEPSDGGHYWDGTPGAARAFGRVFRKLQPRAHLAIAPDPRPWQVEAVPLTEFAAFSDELAPQTYWEIFDSQDTIDLLTERGLAIGDDGVTPELTLRFTQQSLAPFGLPIRPIGEGAASIDSWRRFVHRAQRLGMGNVSVWRFGTSSPDVWRLLKEMPARPGNDQPSLRS